MRWRVAKGPDRDAARVVESTALVSTLAAVPTPNVSWKTVALPAEHGGWGMLAEPALVAAVLAPSAATAGLCVAAAAVFLARQPLKLALTDLSRGVTYPRTTVAGRIAAAFLCVAALAGVAVAAHAPFAAWTYVALAAPFALVQLGYDVRRQGREVLPELLGSAALGALPATALAVAGAPAGVCVAAWLLLAGKNMAAVLYVRARFRMERAADLTGRPPAIAAHVALIGAAFGLAAVPPVVAPAAAMLLARAAWGLSPWHARVRPQTVGWTELAFGLGWALVLSAGLA